MADHVTPYHAGYTARAHGTSEAAGAEPEFMLTIGKVCKVAAQDAISSCRSLIW